MHEFADASRVDGLPLKLGIANKETWIFFQDVYNYLGTHFSTQKFEPATWPWPVFHDRISHYLLRKSLKKFIDSCNVALFEWASELLVEASTLSGSAALVTRLHRYEMFRWTERVNWESVSYVIVNTEAMKAKLLSKTTIGPDKVIAIPPIWFESNQIMSSQRPFNGKIGILCNLIPRKRVYELILAFDSLCNEHPGLCLHIGGGESKEFRDYHEAIQHLVRELRLQDRIIFDGRVEDRWTWYRNIDIFVSFSYSEGMQVAPLEAAASGCYVLSHNWEGANEIFHSDQLFWSENEFVVKALRYCRTADSDRMRVREPLLRFLIEDCEAQRVKTMLREVVENAAFSSH